MKFNSTFCKRIILLLFICTSTLFSNNKNPFANSSNSALSKPLQSSDDSKLKEKAQQWMQNQPVQFLENKGQIADVNGQPVSYVLFEATTPGMNLYVTEKGLSYFFVAPDEDKEEYEREKNHSGKNNLGMSEENFEIKYSRIDMLLKGASIKRENIIKEGESSDFMQFFLGHCPKGITDVHKYKKITIKEIYTGIDWILYNSDNNGFKYDFIVHPGANPKQIEMVYSSLKPLTLNEKGDIVIKTKLGTLTENAPVSYQGDKEIQSSFIKTVNQKNNNDGYDSHIQFAIENYNLKETLTIDPQLAWGTFIGNLAPSVLTGPKSITTDLSGNVFVTGYGSANALFNPGGSAYYQGVSGGGGGEFWILKFSNSGVLQWGTFYGGSGTDESTFICTDNSGNVFLTGYTSSTNFPVMNSGGYFQATPAAASNTDAFILKFTNAGVLQWATLYGGTGSGGPFTQGLSICIDPSNNVYVTGSTMATTFPVLNPGGGAYFQPTKSNPFAGSAYLLKFSNTGTLIWSTLFGTGTGTNTSNSSAVSTDALGNVFISGVGTVPLLNPGGGAYYQAVNAGASDLFVTKFLSTGALFWSTYYGGSGTDKVISICTDNSGNLFATGWTTSLNLPVLNPGCSAYFQNAYGGGSQDAFILKFSNSGVNLWSTYYGGVSNEDFLSNDVITTDPCGNLYIGLNGQGNGTPLQLSSCSVGFNDLTYGGGARDNVILKFSNIGVRLWASYTGGAFAARVSVACDAIGNLFITGEWGTGAGYPILNPGGGAYYVSSGTNSDNGYVVKFAPDPPPTYSQSQINNSGTCSGCNGSASFTVNCGSPPFNYIWSNSSQTLCSTNSVNAISSICPGNYSVQITDQDCHTNTLSYTITGSVGSPPSLTVVPAATLACNPNTTTLIASSTATGVLTYTWSGPSIISGSATPTPVVNLPGNYTVTLTQGVCSNTAIVSVANNTNTPNISIIASNTLLTCLNTSIQVTGTSSTSGVTYSWSPQNVTTNTAVANTSGSYTLAITNTLSGCSSTSVLTIAQNTTAPNISTTLPSTLTCITPSVILTGTSTTSGVTYSWQPQGVTTNTSIANVAGNYTLAISNTLSGCKSTSVITVTQNTVSPNISSNVSGVLTCLNTSVVLLGTSTTSGVTFTWQPQNVNTNTATAINSGNYTLTVANPTTGCLNSTVVVVSQNTTSPNASVSGGGTLTCLNTTVSLLGNSTTSGVSYFWNGPGIISGTNIAIAIADQPGIYTLTVIEPATGCATTTIVSVSSSSIPIASFTQNVTSGSAPLNVSFTNLSSGATSYSWNFGNGVSSLTNPTNVFTTPGTYTVVLTAINAPCTSTTDIVIKVNTSLGIIPQVFTPNGDGINEVFEIKGLDSYPNNNLQIFNRWGNPVYFSKPYKNDWDGTPNTVGKTGANKLPTATYFYILDLGDEYQTIFRGFIQLQY
ncbi:MAG: gliding motility-associated C-terminal domain-containing protein [Bacteroidota bacterium]|nr:gliding motility-associated C-terminal domain-containing protein [Bacteroidota bacterium]MDP3144221.1 gliding motility-associated C-terminal domain-containing protein [Bacteroidota bacterium]